MGYIDKTVFTYAISSVVFDHAYYAGDSGYGYPTPVYMCKIRVVKPGININNVPMKYAYPPATFYSSDWSTVIWTPTDNRQYVYDTSEWPPAERTFRLNKLETLSVLLTPHYDLKLKDANGNLLYDIPDTSGELPNKIYHIEYLIENITTDFRFYDLGTGWKVRFTDVNVTRSLIVFHGGTDINAPGSRVAYLHANEPFRIQLIASNTIPAEPITIVLGTSGIQRTLTPVGGNYPNVCPDPNSLIYTCNEGWSSEYRNTNQQLTIRFSDEHLNQYTHTHYSNLRSILPDIVQQFTVFPCFISILNNPIPSHIFTGDTLTIGCPSDALDMLAGAYVVDRNNVGTFDVNKNVYYGYNTSFEYTTPNNMRNLNELSARLTLQLPNKHDWPRTYYYTIVKMDSKPVYSFDNLPVEFFTNNIYYIDQSTLHVELTISPDIFTNIPTWTFSDDLSTQTGLTVSHNFVISADMYNKMTRVFNIKIEGDRLGTTKTTHVYIDLPPISQLVKSITNVTVDNASGDIPLTCTFTASLTDINNNIISYDNILNKLQFDWEFTNEYRGRIDFKYDSMPQHKYIRYDSMPQHKYIRTANFVSKTMTIGFKEIHYEYVTVACTLSSKRSVSITKTNIVHLVDSPTSIPTTYYCYVTINSNVTSGNVIVNDRAWSQNTTLPQTIEIPIMSTTVRYTIKIEKPGYTSSTTSIDVPTSNSDISMSITINMSGIVNPPIEDPKPKNITYKRFLDSNNGRHVQLKVDTDVQNTSWEMGDGNIEYGNVINYIYSKYGKVFVTCKGDIK